MSGNSIQVNTDLDMVGQLAFTQNYSDFPSNPRPRTLIVKDGEPFIYTELISGSGFFSWVPMGYRQSSHVHTQGIASSEWLVTHNFGSSHFGYFVYDQDHNLVVANVEIVSENVAKIKLYSAITGTAVFFSVETIYSQTVQAAQSLSIGNITLSDQNGVLTSTHPFAAPTINSPSATFGNLVAENFSIDDATFDTVTANVATLQVVSGNTANFTAFTSQVGNVGLLFTSTANVGDLDVAAGATFNGLTHAKAGLTVDGNLTVGNLAISDRFITLNDGETANGVNGISGTYAGIRVDLGKYANGGNVPDAYLYYNSSSKKWVVGDVGLNNEIPLMTDGDLSNYYTRTQSDQKFATLTQVNGLLSEADAANLYAEIGDSYTKVESDARYILTGNLTVTDKVIVINNGQTGNLGATGTVGLQIDRGSIGADAALYFNETTDRWEAGLVGNVSQLATAADLSAIAANNPYDLALSINGLLETGATYLTFVAPYDFTINFATSKAYAGTAPTGSHSILVRVNTTTVSTVTFAAGQTIGTLTGTTRAVTAGQVVTIIQSGTADAQISDVSIVLTGTKA